MGAFATGLMQAFGDRMHEQSLLDLQGEINKRKELSSTLIKMANDPQVRPEHREEYMRQYQVLLSTPYTKKLPKDVGQFSLQLPVEAGKSVSPVPPPQTVQAKGVGAPPQLTPPPGMTNTQGGDMMSGGASASAPPMTIAPPEPPPPQGPFLSPTEIGQREAALKQPELEQAAAMTRRHAFESAMGAGEAAATIMPLQVRGKIMMARQEATAAGLQEGTPQFEQFVAKQFGFTPQVKLSEVFRMLGKEVPPGTGDVLIDAKDAVSALVRSFDVEQQVKGRKDVALIQSGAAGQPEDLAKVWADKLQRGEVQSITQVPSFPRGLKNQVLSYMAAQGMNLPSKNIQQIVQTIEPLKDMASELLAEIEPYKTDNTPFYSTLQRSKYAVGMDQDRKKVAEDISKLELFRIRALAATLKQTVGGRPSQQLIDQAMIHTPNLYKDSPALIHRKLTNLVHSFDQMLDAAWNPGKSAPGGTPPPSASVPPAVVSGRSITTAILENAIRNDPRLKGWTLERLKQAYIGAGWKVD